MLQLKKIKDSGEDWYWTRMRLTNFKKERFSGIIRKFVASSPLGKGDKEHSIYLS